MQAVWVWAIICYRGRRIDVENWMRISSENWMGHSVSEMCVWAFLYVLVWQHFLFSHLCCNANFELGRHIATARDSIFICFCPGASFFEILLIFSAVSLQMVFVNRLIYLWATSLFSHNSINSTDSKDTFLMRFNSKVISLSLPRAGRDCKSLVSNRFHSKHKITVWVCI